MRDDKLKGKILKLGTKLLRLGAQSFEANYSELLKTNFTKGDIPRCLYYEAGEKSHRKGCVIVGLNPGKVGADEKEYYRKQGGALAKGEYAPVLNWWETGEKKKGKNHKYYTRVRNFLKKKLGCKGSIVWTELVKWELAEKGKFKTRTIREHIAAFLRDEINDNWPDWPLIGLGKKAFEALSYSFPERIIIGVPHPTGRFSNDKFRKISREEIKEIKKILSSKKSRKHTLPIAVAVGFQD